MVKQLIALVTTFVLLTLIPVSADALSSGFLQPSQFNSYLVQPTDKGGMQLLELPLNSKYFNLQLAEGNRPILNEPIIIPQYPKHNLQVPVDPNTKPSNEPRWEIEGTPIGGNKLVPAQLARQTSDGYVPDNLDNAGLLTSAQQAELDYDLSYQDDDTGVTVPVSEAYTNAGMAQRVLEDYDLIKPTDGDDSDPIQISKFMSKLFEWVYQNVYDEDDRTAAEILRDEERRQEREQRQKELEKKFNLKKKLSEKSYEDKSLVPTGDPYIFSFTNEACTIKREMGSDESTYFKVNLMVSDPPVFLNMERDLCKGSYMLGIDFNGNGIIDNGLEMLWVADRHTTSFEALENIDFYQDTSKGIFDGKFDINDEFWNLALIMDSDRNFYHPSDLNIKSFGYGDGLFSNNGYLMKKFTSDKHGIGVYADEFGLSDEHFRIMAYCSNCVTLESGKQLEAFGTVQGALRDCTTNDMNYHLAEKHTGEYLRVDEPVNSIPMYDDSLEYCSNFDVAQENPDKYLSHWIAGIASMKHKLAIEDGTTNMELAWEARDTYKEALLQMPSNPFYNVDYCLLQYHMSLPFTHCIKAVEKAIDEREDVEWFKEVHEILTKAGKLS